MSPVRKTVARREQSRQRAVAHLEALSVGRGDTYEHYRALYNLSRSNSSAVSELKPLFRIPGIEPDGRLTFDDSFREIVRSLAKEISLQFSASRLDAL